MENAATQLPDDPFELKEIVFTQRSKIDEQAKRISKLEADIFVYRRELFGRKTEKRVLINFNQENLFNEAEAYSNNTPPEKEKITYERSKKRGKKVSVLGFPPELPRKEVIHELNPEERNCSCGNCRRIISQRTHEELVITEPKVYILVHKYNKYICDPCEHIEKEKEKQDPSYVAKSTIITAPGPKRLLPGSRVNEATLATILIGKFCDGLPFYRLEKIFTRYNVKILRALMCNWAIRVYKNLNPFFDLLKRKLLECPVIGIDETRLRVLEVAGEKQEKLCFMWVFYGYHRDGPVVWYHYAPSRSSSVLEEVLKDYKGIIVSDDFEGYTKFAKKFGLIHCLCNTHARRGFVKAYEMADKTGEAAQYIDWYGKLYKIEDDIRKAGLTTEKIRDHRQEHSKPIMDEMKARLDVQSLMILPESPLGKAISYSLSNWEKLILFLDNGLIPIDNNMPENAIRPFVIGRKNWLFNAVDRGAEASSGFYTLIETAKANGLDPYWYFRMLFIRYPKCTSLEEMEKLLPMNVTPEDLKNFAKECSSES